jgi:autotransporter-associated beta strand protein
MKTLSLCNSLRVAIKLPALALAVAAGLAAGSAQALTTTATFNLGAVDSGTSIPAQSVLSPAWIAAGTLPAGSILRSVSIDARIDTEGGSDTYASDLFVYIDPGAPPSGGEVLQVGGFDALGSPTTMVAWANGDSGTLGTTCVATKTAGTHFPDTIDLNSTGVFLGSRGLIPASWSGTVTVEYDVFVPAAILSFGPGAVVGPLVGNAANIAWTVPYGTDVTTLAPSFTLSSGTSDRDNGGPTTYDFTNPVVYTVTDGANVNTYTVTVTVANSLLWNVAGGGVWDTGTANWLPQPSGSATTFANGNEVVFDNAAGGTIAIAADMSPASTTVSAASGTYTFTGSPIATGSLTKSGGGTLQLNVTPANFSSIAVNSGTLYLYAAESGFAPNAAPFTIPNVTVESGAALQGYRAHATGGTLTLNGGRYWEFNGWDDGGWWGPIYLASDSFFGKSDGWCYAQTLGGEISGPGGFTYDSYGNQQNHPLTLSVANSYAGPTIVKSGMVVCKNVSSLGSGGALSISAGAKVNLDYTGEHNVAALTLGGVAQVGGIYGSLTSDAIFKSAYFEGAGTVRVGDPATFAFITSFGTNVAGSNAVIDAVSANAAAINWIVPAGTNLATLAPEFVLSPGATCSNQTSGAIPGPGFDAGPVVFSVVSQDTTVTNVYTVSVTVITPESTLIWNLAVNGEWNFTNANWKGQSSGLPALFVDGVDVIFDNTAGGTVTVPLTVTVSPGDMAVNATSGTYRWAGGAGKIGGTGTLTKSGAGILKIGNPDPNTLQPMLNTFSGGTIIDGGELWLEPTSHTGLGTGTVTLNAGTLRLYRINAANALIVNGGKLYTQNGFGNNWNGPVTLNATLPIEPFHGLTINGNIEGAGGLTIQTQTNTVTLTGANSYTGPTSVTKGTLKCNSPGSLGGGALSINGGKLNLNYIGTKNVASLTLGGVAMTTPGTYGSVASGGNFQNDTYFTTGSTGTVTLGGGSDYDTWLGGFTFAPGADTTPTGDPDGDDMTNQQEYAFGLDPTLGSSVNPIVAQLDAVTGNFQYTRRATPAATGLTYTVLTSTDLAGWAAGGATETGFTTAGNIQTVTVNVTTPPVGGKLFVRVEAATAP